MSAKLIGKLVLAGDIDIGESEVSSGAFICIPRADLSAVKTLPMYQQVEIISSAELEQLRADLARVTAERDRLNPAWEEYSAQNATLRARVTQLMENCEATRLKREAAEAARDVLHAENAKLKESRDAIAWENQQLTAVLITAGAPEFSSAQHAQEWATETAALRARVAELDGHAEALGKLQIVHAETCRALAIETERNAELVAALDTLTLIVGLTPIVGNKEALQEAFDLARAALASAESATPDHIVDANKMVPAKHCEDCAPEFGCWDGGESCYKQPLQSSTPAKHPDTVRHLLAKALDDALDMMMRPISAMDYDAFRERHKRAIFVMKGAAHD